MPKQAWKRMINIYSSRDTAVPTLLAPEVEEAATKWSGLWASHFSERTRPDLSFTRSHKTLAAPSIVVADGGMSLCRFSKVSMTTSDSKCARKSLNEPSVSGSEDINWQISTIKRLAASTFCLASFVKLRLMSEGVKILSGPVYASRSMACLNARNGSDVLGFMSWDNAS